MGWSLSRGLDYARSEFSLLLVVVKYLEIQGANRDSFIEIKLTFQFMCQSTTQCLHYMCKNSSTFKESLAKTTIALLLFNM